MTILDALDDIFESIALPQNLAKKVALVKSRVGALEEKKIKLEAEVKDLKEALRESNLKNEEIQKLHKRDIANLLQPEQRAHQPLPSSAITKRSRGY